MFAALIKALVPDMARQHGALALVTGALNNRTVITLCLLPGRSVLMRTRRGGPVQSHKRNWRATMFKGLSGLTGGRIVFVFAVATVVAAQSLMQPVSAMHWSVGELLAAFADKWIEVTLVAWTLFLGVTLAKVWLPREGLARSFTLLAVMVVFALLGCLLGYWATYDEGFFPPPSFIASDTVRWVIIGGVLLVVDDLINRKRLSSARLRENETRVARLDRQADEARLQLMQAQIEPHFLFNTLANVKRLCATDADGGRELLAQLMVYLRAALPRLREADATLGSELTLAQAYLAILKIRMGDRLQVVVDVPAQSLSLAFPPMALLTLVENAIKHGLAPAPHGGAIKICVEQRGSQLHVTVADTGVGLRGTGGSGIGISNTRARLAAMFAGDAELTLAANTPTGVVAAINLPMRSVSSTDSLAAASS